MCKRNFRFELQLSSYWQNIIFFYEIAPNFTYSHESLFFKYNYNFLDQLLLPYKFYGRGMWGILFFIFASEPLSNKFTCCVNAHAFENTVRAISKFYWRCPEYLKYACECSHDNDVHLYCIKCALYIRYLWTTYSNSDYRGWAASTMRKIKR